MPRAETCFNKNFKRTRPTREAPFNEPLSLSFQIISQKYAN
jgi:hypothetical protein